MKNDILFFAVNSCMVRILLIMSMPSHFLMDGTAIDDYTAGAELVTDDSAYFMPKEDVRIILGSFALHRVEAPLNSQ